MWVCGNSNIELDLLCQGRVIYTGGSGKGDILRTKTSYPKASVGKTIFKEQNKIPLPEKGGENWQREGGKKEVIPDNKPPIISIPRSRGENK
jgi:hypothetical protein